MAAKIDAVLPLTLRDYERSEILRESLQLFFVDLGRCWVVTPDDEFETIKARIKDDRYRVIPESVVIPELRFYNMVRELHLRNAVRRLAGSSHARVPGWWVQQLVKMAIADFVDTEFYLTLDADVICVKRVTSADVIIGNRAISHRYGHYAHPEWYEWAERTLGLRRSGWEHAVTPSLLNTEAMCQLHAYLTRRVNPALRHLACLLPKTSLARAIVGSWRSYLLRNLPWTEYALYNTFLEANNLYEKYHLVESESRLYGNQVWYSDQFPSWDPEERREGWPVFYFTVVQSNIPVGTSDVREKVRNILSAGKLER